jgi:alkylation response protein AidB-like acyl-CoA dehydrogenase
VSSPTIALEQKLTADLSVFFAIRVRFFQWDEQKELPRELFKKAAAAGWLGACAGAPWNTKYAGTKLAGDIRPEEFDPFHEMIGTEELSRVGSGGLAWGPWMHRTRQMITVALWLQGC